MGLRQQIGHNRRDVGYREKHPHGKNKLHDGQRSFWQGKWPIPVGFVEGQRQEATSYISRGENKSTSHVNQSKHWVGVFVGFDLGYFLLSIVFCHLFHLTHV